MRIDGRTPDQMRPIRVTLDFIPSAEGSVLIEVGRTRVICTASIEETVPPFLRNSGKIPKLQFVFDIDIGYHVFYGVKLKTNAQGLKLDKLTKLVSDVFRGSYEPISYTELWNKIMPLAEIKERAAKNYVKDLVDLKLVRHTDDERYEPVFNSNEVNKGV